MIIQCPCSKKLKVADSLRGKKVRCPQCKEIMVVDKPVSATSKPKKKRASGKSRKRRTPQPDIAPYDDLGPIDDPYGQAPQRRRKRRTATKKLPRWIIPGLLVCAGVAFLYIAVFVVVPNISLAMKRQNSGVTPPEMAPAHHDAIGNWSFDIDATISRTTDQSFRAKLEKMRTGDLSLSLEIVADGTCFTTLRYGRESFLGAGHWGHDPSGDMYMNYSHQDGKKLLAMKIDNAVLEDSNTLEVMASSMFGVPHMWVYRR